MRHDAVTEMVGAIILASVAALAIGIVILVFFANPLPTSVPSFHGLVSNASTTVYIHHEGGDSLRIGQFKILVDGVDETYNFTKSITGPFSLGKVMNATLPTMPGRLVMVFTSSWGGQTVLLSANLAEKIPYTPAGWYSGYWLYRKKITIDHTKVSGSPTDFPVLLNYQESALAQGMGKAQLDADDVLFTASDGVTKLPHEIESFTSNNGAIVTWVKVPALSSVTDTVIYLYYGNSGASSQQAAANVWTNGYAGVWHMGEATGTIRLDSTNNNNDVSETNGPIAMSSSGKIGNAADFVRASSQYLSITDAAQTGLDITGSITMEGWAKNDETAAPPFTILDKARGSTCGSGDPPYYIRLNQGNSGYVREDMVVNGVCGADPTDPQGTMTSLTSGSWVHVVGVFNGSTGFIYKNAVQTDSGSLTAPYDSNGAFYIGSQVNANYFDGLLDEVRVSNIARSQDWITTEYTNQNNPGTCAGCFVSSISTEQTQGMMF